MKLLKVVNGLDTSMVINKIYFLREFEYVYNEKLHCLKQTW